MSTNTYSVTGAMSGTSLDGLDMAFCVFERQQAGWAYRIEQAKTIPYPEHWKQKILELEDAPATVFCEADRLLGHYMGAQIRHFHESLNLKPDFVASHGHTIFHQPEKQFTVQIGHGAALAKETGIPVICDFRANDVAWGGQGAPLVPIGDELLFGQYEACLNLGGIANLSAKKDGKRISWDTSVCNMALNYLAARLHQSYDENGRIARSGQLQPSLFQTLNQLIYFQQPPPKSLGKEWFLAHMASILGASSFSIPDLSHTVVHHVAHQIHRALAYSQVEEGSLLVTGGGAFHDYLLEQIQAYCPAIKVEVPEQKIVEFKEALIFAFLGVLRFLDMPNTLQTVTGAKKDTVGGAIYLP